MKKAIPCLVLILICTVCQDSFSDQYRSWNISDGSKIKARLASVSGTHAFLKDEKGKMYQVPIAELPKSQQRRIRQLRTDGEVGHAVQYYQNTDDYPDRMLIPTYNQGEFSNGISTCGPNSLVNFILWWDRTGIYDIPEGETEKEKAKWLHQKLYVYMNASNGTSLKDMVEGAKKYFKEYPSAEYDFQVESFMNLTPEILYEQTRGNNACIMTVSFIENEHLTSRHYVSLLDVTAKKSFIFNTWGRFFRGQFVTPDYGSPLLNDDLKKVAVELDLLSTANVDDENGKKTRWVICHYDPLLVVRPVHRKNPIPEKTKIAQLQEEPPAAKVQLPPIKNRERLSEEELITILAQKEDQTFSLRSSQWDFHYKDIRFLRQKETSAFINTKRKSRYPKRYGWKVDNNGRLVLTHRSKSMNGKTAYKFTAKLNSQDKLELTSVVNANVILMED